MRNEVQRVGCEACGWRGKRVFDTDTECGHDYGCSCSPFGHCPKCGAWVKSMAAIRSTQAASKAPTISIEEGEAILRASAEAHEDADDGYTEDDFKRDFDTTTGECLKCGSFHLPGECPADDDLGDDRADLEWLARHDAGEDRDDEAKTTEKKESTAAHLARLKQRLEVDAPLAPVRSAAIAIERLWIPGVGQIRPARVVGMARSLELVAMMNPPAVAAPPAEVLAANPEAPYRVIAGRHRISSAARNGEKVVYCNVYEGLTPAQEALLALTENQARSAAWVRDLESVADLINGKAQLTEDDLAFLLGVSVTSVRELVKIARLPESLLNQIYAGHVTKATAKRMTRLSASARDRLSESAAAGEAITADDVQHALTGQRDSLADLFEQQHEQGEDTIAIPSVSDARALFEPLRALSVDPQQSSRVRALAGALCAELEG